MARRVKNQSDWFDKQRILRSQWSERIKKHSPAAKSELAALEHDFGISPVFADPQKFEDARELITEYMNALRDIREGIEREKLELKRMLEGEKEPPKKRGGRGRGKGKPKVTTGIVRPEVGKLYTDPSTGEKLYIVDTVKGIGENVAGVTFNVDSVQTSAVDEEKAAYWADLARKAIAEARHFALQARKAADANRLLDERKAKSAGKKAAAAAKEYENKAKFYAGIRYRFNVTKRGRKIEQRPGDPPLYNHPDENRLFKWEDDAILRARRVITASLLWYEKRRKAGRKIEEEERRAKERKKIRKETKARIRPRTGRRIVKAGSYEAEVLGIAPGTIVTEEVREDIRPAEVLRIRREAEAKARARERRGKKGGKRSPARRSSISAWEGEPEGEPKKHRLVQRGSHEHLVLGLKPGTPIKTPGGARRGGSAAEVPKPRRKPSGRLAAGERRLIEAEISPTGKFKMPKKPKDNPFFGSDTSELEAQAEQALANYKEEISSWQHSMQMGRTNGQALIRAYDWLENARANYSLAEMKQKAKRVQAQKGKIRDAIVALMGESGSDLFSNPKNPSTKTHLKTGSKFLAKSEKQWDKYCKSLKINDLLDAYQSLIIAERELGYAKDKKGVAQAKSGLKAAHAELAVHKKKASKKKSTKKKSTKKKASKKKASKKKAK